MGSAQDGGRGKWATDLALMGQRRSRGLRGDGGPVVPLLDPDWIEGGRSRAAALHGCRPEVAGGSGTGRTRPDPWPEQCRSTKTGQQGVEDELHGAGGEEHCSRGEERG